MNRPRFATHKQRPLSAIFIGSFDSNSTASPPELPVLPSSPSTSSNGSGLPSPPATNSTGSGSVGEDNTTGRSSRGKPASEMYNGSFNKSQTSIRSRTAPLSDDEDDSHDNENDEDNTARLNLQRKRSSMATTTKENMSALQRVRSLTERNRMVLDKLSSMSRLSSPAPSQVSRSPFTPPTKITSSADSPFTSRLTSSRPRTSLSNLRPSAGSSSSVRPDQRDYTPSGSETERETETQRDSSQNYSSNDSKSTTPTTAYSEARSTHTHDRFDRLRRQSAPDSPDKSLRHANTDHQSRDRDGDTSKSRARSRGPSPGPSRTPRKRLSVMSMRHGDADNGKDDVASAALAAVANSRRSPTGSRRSRIAPPTEFRESERRSLDIKEPITPLRNRERERAQRRSPSPRSPRASTSTSNNSSPRKSGVTRPSTVRELTRKHQTRWLSEDLSAQDREDNSTNYGRRQSQKTGSTDSPIRSLVGEGLRAAGLTRRKEGEEDPFAVNGSGAVIPRRTRSSNGEGQYQSPAGPSSRAADPRTPAQRQERKNVYSANRPGTSMAALHSDELRTTGLRDRTSYPLEREPSSSSSQQASEHSSGRERIYSPPFGSRDNRQTIIPLPVNFTGAAKDPYTEHRRLLSEALSVFESQLSRLPPMGQTTTSTIPEVFHTSQHLVQMTEKLNNKLKAASSRSLESQIEAEVSDVPDQQKAAEIWSEVGMDHRDNLRVHDEVIRTMTAFLIGVGKVLRDATALPSNGNQQQQQHLRTMSLDEVSVNKPQSGLDPGSAGTLSADRRSSEGRRSRETRRSWDPRDSNTTTSSRLRISSRERTNGASSRPGSSMNQVQSATSSGGNKSVADGVMDRTPHTARDTPSRLANSRAYTTPREPRMSTTDPSLRQSQSQSFNSPDSYEPSPTPASRNSHDRNRALAPLAIPPSLPTLPSEPLLQRRSATSSTSTSTTEQSSRRKISNNSNITVRGDTSSSTSTSFQPIIKPSNPTTAVTPHTVYSPEMHSASLPRNDSFTHMNGGVTFSPATISISTTLSGLQQKHETRERERTVSGSSVEEPSPSSAVSALRSPMSGSETERPRTLGLRSRLSVDKSRTPEHRGTIGTSGSASTLLSSRRERRRTITEIFQR